jgi:hypothetical protein
VEDEDGHGVARMEKKKESRRAAEDRRRKGTIDGWWRATHDEKKMYLTRKTSTGDNAHRTKMTRTKRSQSRQAGRKRAKTVHETRKRGA